MVIKFIGRNIIQQPSNYLDTLHGGWQISSRQPTGMPNDISLNSSVSNQVLWKSWRSKLIVMDLTRHIRRWMHVGLTTMFQQQSTEIPNRPKMHKSYMNSWPDVAHISKVLKQIVSFIISPCSCVLMMYVSVRKCWRNLKFVLKENSWSTFVMYNIEFGTISYFHVHFASRSTCSLGRWRYFESLGTW